MTEAEKALIVAFIDNSIANLQALRGAISILCRDKVCSISVPGKEDASPLSDHDFGKAYERMMSGIQRAGDDLPEETATNA